MVSRRLFVELGVASLVSSNALSTESIKRVGFERGDPFLRPDPSLLRSSWIPHGDQDDDKAIIPDANPFFRQSLVDIAQGFIGVNRWDESKSKIEQMLSLFNCPFTVKENGRDHFTAFCAAGVGYCAALAYSRGKNDLKILAPILRAVDYHNFWPSSAVRDMVHVAVGKRRWVSNRSASGKPKSGWIVCFDWDERPDELAVDHCGIVVDATANSLTTIEFNTSPEQKGSQGDGGYVRKREDRMLNRTVKGFIITDSL